MRTGLQEDGRRARLQAMIEAEPERLRRRSISLGVAVTDADDVAQDAALRAWRSIEQVRSSDEGQLCSWLDVIARRAALDFARRRLARPTTPLSDEVVDRSDPADEVATRQLARGALRAIMDLPTALREPFLLNVVEGLPAPEVARRLDLAPATVRQRVSRARKALVACQDSTG